MDKRKTGNLIKEARTKKKYTQRELGDLLGVSDKAVSRWENGESFPNVGILESLAVALDVRIQDIVTGDKQVNTDGVVDVVVRIARLQKKEAKRKVVRNSLLIIAIFCCFVSGCSALGNKSIFFDNVSIIVYVILMFITLALILIGCALQNETDKKEMNKFCKYVKLVALLSFLWSTLLTLCVFIMVINDYIPLEMELSSVGPFVNWQLIALFSLNIVMIVWEVYRCERCDESIHWGWFVSIATMYLTVLYGDLLHRMISAQGAMESLLLRTVVVVIVMGISLVVAKVLTSNNSYK